MALPSVGTFLGGIGALLGKASTYIPGKVEKLKNEREALLIERGNLERLNMDINNPDHRKKAVRLSAVIDRLSIIDGLLRAKAAD